MYGIFWRVDVSVRTQTWDGKGSLVAFVVSLNLHRRHLSSSQLGVVGLDVERELAKEAQAKEQARKSTNSTFQKVEKSEIQAAEQAAKLVGMNRQYISDAKKIERQAPELLADVRAGLLNMPAANCSRVQRNLGRREHRRGDRLTSEQAGGKVALVTLCCAAQRLPLNECRLTNLPGRRVAARSCAAICLSM